MSIFRTIATAAIVTGVAIGLAPTATADPLPTSLYSPEAQFIFDLQPIDGQPVDVIQGEIMTRVEAHTVYLSDRDLAKLSSTGDKALAAFLRSRSLIYAGKLVTTWAYADQLTAAYTGVELRRSGMSITDAMSGLTEAMTYFGVSENTKTLWQICFNNGFNVNDVQVVKKWFDPSS